MMRAQKAVVKSIQGSSLELELEDRQVVRWSTEGAPDDLAVGQTVWISISPEPPQTGKDLLNSILGNDAGNP